MVLKKDQRDSSNYIIFFKFLRVSGVNFHLIMYASYIFHLKMEDTEFQARFTISYVAISSGDGLSSGDLCFHHRTFPFREWGQK
ncbi:uncharacterized protein [Spinacia oleracea]|uniref:Uncharacterized protein isoform X4 n=1 Tax=Spinacia oleracea TaxID=3562 RepID=A0ABM3RV79_SPIOL|nr:uncharacterized protein LOC110784534 isoform X4 [Spinacia oleracea]